MTDARGIRLVARDVTLTSGTTDDAGGGAISGADIRIYANAGASCSIDVFRPLLTHEIGHAPGFADVDFNSGPAVNFDDDTDGSTALATLTNSWATLVNTLNPAGSASTRRVPTSSWKARASAAGSATARRRRVALSAADAARLRPTA